MPAEPSLCLLAFSFTVFLNKGACRSCALSLRRIDQCQGHIPESPPVFSRLKSSQGSNKREPWWSELACLDRKSQCSGHWASRLYSQFFFPFSSSFPTSFFCFVFFTILVFFDNLNEAYFQTVVLVITFLIFLSLFLICGFCRII